MMDRRECFRRLLLGAVAGPQMLEAIAEAEIAAVPGMHSISGTMKISQSVMEAVQPQNDAFVAAMSSILEKLAGDLQKSNDRLMLAFGPADHIEGTHFEYDLT